MILNMPMKLITFACAFLLVTTVCITPATGQPRANKEYELKAFHLAIKSYLQFVGQNPSNIEAMAKLGDSFRHINEMKSAVEWYERAFTAPQLPSLFISATAIFGPAVESMW